MGMIIDYSRAAASKAANESFQKDVEAKIIYLENLKNEFHTEWSVEEELRKGRSAIIEDTIPILKENGIKLAKPLSRCNNEEIVRELKEAAKILPFPAKEEIEVARVKIDGRYNQIVEQGKKLDQLFDKLSQFHLVETDYDQEVIVSLEEYKKNSSSKIKNEKEDQKNDIQEENMETTADLSMELDEELEQVKRIETAEPELISSLDDLINQKLDDSSEEKTPEIIEESDLTLLEEELDFDDAFDSIFAEVTGEKENEDLDDTQRMEQFLATGQESLENEPDFQTYELKEDQTLARIVEYVYDGNLSWYDIYQYGNNQGMIDRKCAEFKIAPEDAAYKEGVLTGLTLEYPKNFITYSEISPVEDMSSGMSKTA